MPTVIFTPLAEEDLLQIWLYLAIEADEEAADRFVDQIEEKCRRILRSAKGFRQRPELLPDLRSFPFKTYVIFYVPTESGIDVIRIIHAARDIEQVINE